MDLLIDEKRLKSVEAEGEHEGDPTGIFIRAKHPTTNKWMSVDIYVLQKDSLLAWLKSRGGDNRWAEDTVGILLGHGHLHEDEKKDETSKG
jgi:hypothetical protein